MRFAATKIPPSSMPRRSVGIVGLILVMVFSAAANPPAWIEGEVLVRYRETPAGRIARHAIPEPGTQRRGLRAMSTLKGRRIEVVRAPERGTLEILQEYARRPDVELVTPNYVRHIQRSTIPDADRFHQQWGLLNTGQTVNGFSGTPGADIAATRAWPMSRPSEPELVIAVIDTGVD